MNYSEKKIALNGRLKTNVKGIAIGENFKQYVNLRYGDEYPRGILGHSKINTNALDNPKVRSIHQLRKEQPAESHVIVQALDSNGANPKLYTNDTAIPSAGNFLGSGGTETILYTEDTSAGTGRFSEAPDGSVIYCNGKETLVWGGDEFRIASFIRYNPDDNTEKWDYTEQVNNTDTTQVAEFTKTGGDLDANTVVLHHFDNSDSDSAVDPTPSGAVAHNITKTNAVFSTTQKKFGTHSIYFDGTGDYATMSDHADFDFDGGIWTMDMWVYQSTSSSGIRTLYYQETDSDNFIQLLTSTTFGNITFVFYIKDTGTYTVQLSGSGYSPNQWYHIAIVENGDDYYLFINGSLVEYKSDSDRAGTYTGDPTLGMTTGGTQYFTGYIDELRIVNGTAIWTSAFTPNNSAYPVNSCEFYVGSILPIQGIYFDAETANTSSCTPIISYWDGGDWTSVGTVTDGTNNGTGALEQDGEMTWTYTEGNDKPRIIDSQFFYWYKLSLDGIDDATTVSYVTVDIPFQPLKDIWDGELRTILSCLQWDDDTQTYFDHTVSIFEDYYDSNDSGTYAGLTDSSSDPVIDIDSADDYMLIGSTERLSGLSFNLVSGHENSTSSVMSIAYWEGDGWADVGTIVDGTLGSNATLNKSGFVTWNAPDYGTEFRRQDLSTRRTDPLSKSPSPNTTVGFDSYYMENRDNNSWKEGVLAKKTSESVKKSPFLNMQYEYPLYWYKITFSDDIAGDLQVYHIGAIPAPVEMGTYSYPVFHNNSIWLLNDTSQHKNEILKLAGGTVNVANGSGTYSARVGEEDGWVGGASIKLVLKDNVVPVLILFKKNKTYAVYGSGDVSNPIQIDDKIGCVAAGTIKTAKLSTDSGDISIVIFQSDKGIYGCNGFTVFELSEDISDLFDQNSSTHILTTRITNSEAIYDETKNEYHWIWTSTGTTHNKELVFDCKRMKWYEIQRGSGALIQCGASVKDTSGIPYTYGSIDDGYMMLLENGTTFATASDTNDIQCTLQTADMTLPGRDQLDGIATKSILKNVSLHSVSKTSTSNTIAVTHYGDTKTTASNNTATFDAGDSGEEVQIVNWSPNIGPFIYHSLKFVITNSNDTIGFEPIYLALLYEAPRQNLRG